MHLPCNVAYAVPPVVTMTHPKQPPAHASVAKRIRWARKHSGHTLDGLAAAMGTTRQTIIRWEKGFYLPNLESRRKLAAATGQDPSFFTDSDSSDEDDEEEGELAVQLARMITALVRAELRRGETIATANDELRQAGNQPHATRTALLRTGAR